MKLDASNQANEKKLDILFISILFSKKKLKKNNYLLFIKFSCSCIKKNWQKMIEMRGKKYKYRLRNIAFRPNISKAVKDSRPLERSRETTTNNKC